MSSLACKVAKSFRAVEIALVAAAAIDLCVNILASHHHGFGFHTHLGHFEAVFLCYEWLSTARGR